MNTLYDSDSFTVTHMLANAQAQSESSAAFLGQGNTTLSDVKTDQYPQGVPMLARHGFEIVDKRSGKEVYLDGSWAELFQHHIVAWQVNMPTQEEVEETIEQYAGLAQNPVVIH
jgi:hypothetical protein